MDNYEKRKRVLVLFELTFEVFQYIIMPEPYRDLPIVSWFYLIEMNDSLSLFHYVREENSFDVCAMDEFGVDGTRTKLLRIGPLWGMVIPLLFMKSDELLIEDGGQMVSYNLTNKQIKKFACIWRKRSISSWIYNRV